MDESITYPYVIFKIDGSLYCMNSRYLSSIRQMPAYEKVAHAPASVMGMFRHGDQVVSLIDLRTELGMTSMSQDCEEFEKMIDARKQDHINWVTELERCALSGEPFLLAKDPHKCAFGKWYDSYETDNQTVSFHLRKIDTPHKKLHKAAFDVENCLQDCDNCRREQCLKSLLKSIKEETVPSIMGLLDETKDLFRSSIYKEMVLILDGVNWGIAVDEIEGIEVLNLLEWREQEVMKSQCSYILNVLESPRHEGLIFELNIDAFSTRLQELEKTF